MSDDTRAPRQPFYNGPQPEGVGETGETRELPDVQDQLEAALARSRGIGDDGDVTNEDVLAGEDLAFDGRAEEPTDPALAPQEDVAVAFADPLADQPAGGEADPNETVGLDRSELAAVLGHQPSEDADVSGTESNDGPSDALSHDAEVGDAPGSTDAEPEQHSLAPVEDATEAADPAYAEVPVAERVVAEEDDAADFPVTEPVPAQDLVADAIGAEAVAAITVDTLGSATAPDDGQDAPRRTLEIDRTAAGVAAVGAAQTRTAPEEEVSVLVTETVTEQLADDGESVEAVTVTERVDVLEAPATAVLPEQGTEAEVEAEAEAEAGSDVDSEAGVDASTVPDGVSATETSADAEADTNTPVVAVESDSDKLGSNDEPRDGDTAGVVTPAAAAAAAAAGAAGSADDATFAPLQLSAPTDNDDLAPVKPKKRGNRMFAVFVALVASVVFAALYLLAFALLRTAFNTGLDPIGEASEFAITAAFTVPVTVFAAFGVLWAVIVNRAGWWAYVLGGFLAAALVLVGYYVGAALQQHLADGLPLTSIQLDEVLSKFRASEHLLTALVAAIAAREAFTWVGGIAAARGRRVSRANRRAKLSYEKRMAERTAETAEANGVDA